MVVVVKLVMKIRIKKIFLNNKNKKDVSNNTESANLGPQVRLTSIELIIWYPNPKPKPFRYSTGTRLHASTPRIHARKRVDLTRLQ